MGLSNKRLRDRLRVTHLAAALATCVFVYSPFAAEPGFVTVMRFAVGPALVITGLMMWRLPKLRRKRHHAHRG